MRGASLTSCPRAYPCGLADALPIARPDVSRHLRVLREAGLVTVEQDAQRRIYSLRPEAMVEVDKWLEPYRSGRGGVPPRTSI